MLIWLLNHPSFTAEKRLLNCLYQRRVQNPFQLLTILAKNSILDVQRSSEYVSYYYHFTKSYFNNFEARK